MDTIESSLKNVRNYVIQEEFKGYDPYDTLNCWIDLTRFGKWPSVLAIQVQKRNFLNIRPLLGIRKSHNPKGMGLLLHAFCLLYELNPHPEIRQNMDYLFDWLCENTSKGYSGECWGYNFDWASPEKVLKAYTPSIVVTGFVAKGIFKYYELTGCEKAAEVLNGACNFVLKDLPRIDNEKGICFSYTPIKKDCCFNASMLGAELFAMCYTVTGDKELQEMARMAVDFTLSYQEDNGVWNYSVDLDSDRQRKQIDFHQGYILESLFSFVTHCDVADQKYSEALVRGADFYKNNQFFEEGRSKWRLPQEWPVEIHNQSQGIITFALLSKLNPVYLDFARRIALWTCSHMQDKRGFFYYRRYRFVMNKISFMRWSQAWMFLALCSLKKADPGE